MTTMTTGWVFLNESKEKKKHWWHRKSKNKDKKHVSWWDNCSIGVDNNHMSYVWYQEYEQQSICEDPPINESINYSYHRPSIHRSDYLDALSSSVHYFVFTPEGELRIYQRYNSQKKTHPMDTHYPHTCQQCHRKISWNELIGANINITLGELDYKKYKQLKRLWRMKNVEFYCCFCFHDHFKKKEKKIIPWFSGTLRFYSDDNELISW